MTYIRLNPKSGLFITPRRKPCKSSAAAHKADFLIDLEHGRQHAPIIYGKMCIGRPGRLLCTGSIAAHIIWLEKLNKGRRVQEDLDLYLPYGSN